MAAPTRSTPSIDLNGATADMLAVELREHAQRVKDGAEESGQPRIAAGRVRFIERFATQLERMSAASDE